MRIDLSNYRNIVVLTGAGISAGSGLRTYRGPGGVWEEYEVEKYGNADALQQWPAETWKLFGSMRAPVRAAQPNAAHLALARAEAGLRHDQEFMVVTQNVDGLHQRAGSENVVELHGNICVTRCTSAACKLAPFADDNDYASGVPICPECSSALRPDIVLFGEIIPAEPGWLSKRALRDCDLFISIGTSGLVSPASDFVRSAEYAGARTIYVNLEPLVPRNKAFQEEYLGKAEEILPGLLGIAS